MPEKTKPEEDKQKQKEKEIEKTLPEQDEDLWSSDQQERGYYYDDAHGYEVYTPDEDEDDII
jgi:hypothetical protein